MKKLVFPVFILVTTVFAFGDVTIDQAIENARKQMEVDLPAAAQIVVAGFEANTEIATYVTEKLETSLVNGRKFTVIDRSHWSAVQRERDYQHSGYVSDSEAAQLGKELGADIFIIGKLRKINNTSYQFSISAIDVETAKIESAFDTGIKMDKTLEGLLGITQQRELEQAAVAAQQAAAAEKREQERAAAAEKREQQQAAAAEKRERERERKKAEQAASAARRDMKIVLGARGAFAIGFNAPSEDYFGSGSSRDGTSVFDTFALSGFFGLNSVSNAMGFRVEGTYIHDNTLDVSVGGASREYSWNSLDFSALFNFGYAEKNLFCLYAGPYVSFPLGDLSGSQSGEIEKDILGMFSSWGLLGGLRFGMKAGPGYITLDGRYFYDLNETKVTVGSTTDTNFARRSGILIGLGYEFWL
jgi:hypothetical protein